MKQFYKKSKSAQPPQTSECQQHNLMLNNKETGFSPMDNIEVITYNMINVLGWSDTDLVAEMLEDIKSNIRNLNTMYHKKMESKRQHRQREIIDLLELGQLWTGNSDWMESRDGPNDCFLVDGTPVSIIHVAVMCGGPNPETLEFHNISNPTGGIQNPTVWVPAQEGNDGWRIGSARVQETAGEEKTNQVSSDDWEDNLRRALRGCNKESEIEDIIRIRREARIAN